MCPFVFQHQIFYIRINSNIIILDKNQKQLFDINNKEEYINTSHEKNSLNYLISQILKVLI